MTPEPSSPPPRPAELNEAIAAFDATLAQMDAQLAELRRFALYHQQSGALTRNEIASLKSAKALRFDTTDTW